MPPRPAQAKLDPETLALRVLAHIAGDEVLLPRFLGLSGLDAASLKAGLGDPALLGGVLDFVLGDERLVSELAAAFEIPPESFARARRKLPGAAPDL
jgi:hypothetical protein